MTHSNQTPEAVIVNQLFCKSDSVRLRRLLPKFCEVVRFNPETNMVRMQNTETGDGAWLRPDHVFDFPAEIGMVYSVHSEKFPGLRILLKSITGEILDGKSYAVAIFDAVERIERIHFHAN